jgi:hypothetical protein
MTSDSRAVDALANAIDGALDTWDANAAPPWADALTDSHAIAEAAIKLLPQFGYAVSAITLDDPSTESLRTESGKDPHVLRSRSTR